MASVAYVDPGNFATNFAAGAGRGYELAWVVVAASAIALLVQYATAKAGLATGRSLPELCRERFGSRMNIMLWLQAEAVAMATDLAEFVGATVGLNLVFGVPLLPGGLITAALAFALLTLERRGYRRYELVVIALLALVAAGFGYLFLVVGGQHYGQLARGLFPHTGDAPAMSLAAGIIGATVMPHVVYLHSALHTRRERPATPAGRRLRLISNRWDCVLGLGAAGLLNLAMLCVAAAGLRHDGLAAHGDFREIAGRLGTVAGGGTTVAFGVALMASGLSSSAVGTHAGQVVMAGFTRWRIPVLWRRALTVLPSLAVFALRASPGQVLIWSQVALSFGIPFALVPLLLVTRDRALMGDMVNSRLTSALLLGATVIITGLNVFLVARQAVTM